MKNEEFEIELPTEETVMIKAKANYRKSKFNFTGGTILVTNHSIYFYTDKNNTEEKVIEIPLDQVHVTRKAKSLGILNNRLIIGDSQGEERIFILRNRNDVLEAIEEQLRQQ